METRGAGIVVQSDLVQLLRQHHAPDLPMTACRVRRYFDPDGGAGTTQAMPQQFTSWEAIYKTLRATFPDDRYHMGAAISHVEPQSSQASATSRRKCVIPALCASSGRHTSHWARASSTSISSERHDDPALDEMRKLAGIPVRHADAAMRGVLVNLRGVGCAVQAVGRLG